MNYGNLITGAFRVTWHYKFLWLYGIFLGGSINFGSFNYNFNLNDSDTRRFRNLDTVQEVARWVNANLPLIIAFVLILAFFAIIFWIFRIISQSAVVWTVDQSEKAATPTFTEAFKIGLKYFWRLFGLTLLISLFFLLFLLIFLIPPFIIFFSTIEKGTLIMLPIFALIILLLILILIPLIIIVNIIVMYAIRFLVINDERIVESISSSSKLLRKNLGASLLVWLLSAAIGIGITVALLVVLILLGIPIGILAYFLIASGVTITKIVIMAALTIALLTIILIVGGFGQAYFSAFWTLAWRELTRLEKAPEG